MIDRSLRQVRRPSTVVITLLALLSLGAAAPARAQTTGSSSLPAPSATSFLIAVKPQYSEGTYGTSTTTQVLYVPFLLEWDPTDRFNLDLTIPYIWQHGQGVLTTLGAGPLRARGGGVTARRQGHGRISSQAPVRTESGLGDIILEADYRLVDDQKLVPEITPMVAIKFPTADETRGLGTGEFDELIGVNLAKSLTERWSVLGTFAYTFVGSPPGLDLDNSFGWSLGARYAFTRAFRLTGYFEGATAIAPGESDPLDVRAVAAYDVTRALQVSASVLGGLSDGSPDFGASVGFAVRF